MPKKFTVDIVFMLTEIQALFFSVDTKYTDEFMVSVGCGIHVFINHAKLGRFLGNWGQGAFKRLVGIVQWMDFFGMMLGTKYNVDSKAYIAEVIYSVELLLEVIHISCFEHRFIKSRLVW
jgi:hypothetical protein